MTAFMVDIRQDRLTIASDTCGYIVGAQVKPVGFASKVIAIPHLRAVLFGRGITWIGYRAAVDLMVSPQHQTIEAAAAALPAMLREITERYAAESGIEDHRELQIFEALFGGYSLRDRRAKLWGFYNYRDDYAPEEVPAGLHGTLALPPLPPEFKPPELDKLPLERRLIAGMQAQKRFAAALVTRPLRDGSTNPAAGCGKSIIGGEIIVTEATAAGVTSRSVARFADYDETAHASAAVAARVLRGDEIVDVRDGLVHVDAMIPPAGGEAAAAAASGASRAERRRAEKLARKAARRAA